MIYCAAAAYSTLRRSLARDEGERERTSRAVRRRDVKGQGVKGHLEANVGQLVAGSSCVLRLLHSHHSFPACQLTANTVINSSFRSDHSINDPCGI